jgi:hypothetical protein
MKYLEPSFTVSPAAKVFPGTCERCVFGRGEHAEGCRVIIDFITRKVEDAVDEFKSTLIADTLNRTVCGVTWKTTFHLPPDQFGPVG